nr:hypothetical protein [Tanacetum cinerariifolium]
MRFWFVQEIAEEEGLLKFLRDRCDELRKKNAKRRVLICEMEALGEQVVLDDFTPMVTLESNSDVTSPRSNNLSTSNHVSLDSRHWSPSSGGLRLGLCLYAFFGNPPQDCEATHGSEALKWKRLWLNSELRKKLRKNTRFEASDGQSLGYRMRIPERIPLCRTTPLNLCSREAKCNVGPLLADSPYRANEELRR